MKTMYSSFYVISKVFVHGSNSFGFHKFLIGRLAQLVERALRMRKVVGSIPTASTFLAPFAIFCNGFIWSGIYSKLLYLFDIFCYHKSEYTMNDDRTDEDRIIEALVVEGKQALYEDVDFLPLRQSLYNVENVVPEYDDEISQNIE